MVYFVIAIHMQALSNCRYKNRLSACRDQRRLLKQSTITFLSKERQEGLSLMKWLFWYVSYFTRCDLLLTLLYSVWTVFLCSLKADLSFVSKWSYTVIVESWVKTVDTKNWAFTLISSTPELMNKMAKETSFDPRLLLSWNYSVH